MAADRKTPSPSTGEGGGEGGDLFSGGVPRDMMPRRLSSPRLAELSIRDFAIVDRMRIEWTGGFIALTGETGAGKSIIIDALGAAMGDRFDPSWLRAGAERGGVEAVFWDVGGEELAAALA